jgi:hypothetical protein
MERKHEGSEQEGHGVFGTSTDEDFEHALIRQPSLFPSIVPNRDKYRASGCHYPMGSKASQPARTHEPDFFR